MRKDDISRGASPVRKDDISREASPVRKDDISKGALQRMSECGSPKGSYN